MWVWVWLWGWVDAATAAAAVERAVLALDCGGEEGLFKDWEVGEVALVAIVRASAGVVVEIATLEVVETWVDEVRPEEGEVVEDEAL